MPSYSCQGSATGLLAGFYNICTLSSVHSADRYSELKTEIKKVEHQRDQTLSDFESLEKSFADLHQRYLKLKTASQALQQVLPLSTKVPSYN